MRCYLIPIRLDKKRKLGIAKSGGMVGIEKLSSTAEGSCSNSAKKSYSTCSNWIISCDSAIPFLGIYLPPQTQSFKQVYKGTGVRMFTATVFVVWELEAVWGGCGVAWGGRK